MGPFKQGENYHISRPSFANKGRLSLKHIFFYLWQSGSIALVDVTFLKRLMLVFQGEQD